MHNVRELDVYKRAYDLTIILYKITANFPDVEKFGLVAQIRRAAISINSNLMEGGARNTDGEFRQFIGIARGSANELIFQIYVSKDLGFISKEQSESIIDELERIGKMLTNLSASYK
ncbi:MAG: four helix bundle protein [Proteobacteria bacterium]|nr:four helix bundle protein [Pseudomonadota bacterium]